MGLNRGPSLKGPGGGGWHYRPGYGKIFRQGGQNISGINNTLPVAREGLPFILGSLAVAYLSALAGWCWPTWLLIVFALFSTWFFRDPDRVAPQEEGAVVSPADGRVIKVEQMLDERFLGLPTLKISVFMNVFNVHVNRVPLTGRVEGVRYYPGKFLNASLDKASTDNEHNCLILTAGPIRIAVVQIAGLIARRIVCWVKPGDEVVRGQRFGLIRFGSRLDIYLPPETRVEVKPGQKVAAGETILGYLP